MRNIHRSTVIFSAAILLCSTTLGTVPKQAFADGIPKAANVAALKGLVNFGLTSTELIYTAIKADSPEMPSGSDARRSLRQLERGYKQSITVQRAGYKLLDTSADWIIGTSSLAGGLPGVLVGTAATWGKNQAMGALNSKLDKDAKIYLANNLDKFNGANGLTYEKLREETDIEKVKKAIDDNGLLLEFKEGFADDEVAKNAIRDAFAKNIMSTQKATLDKIRANTVNIENTKSDLKKLGRVFSTYKKEVNNKLVDLENRTQSVEVAIGEAQVAIGDLQTSVAKNSQDLEIVGEVLFEQSSPKQKLALLNRGLPAGLSVENRQSLTKYYEAEDKKQELISGVQEFVGAANSIGQIAKNLGINDPDLDKAIGFANQGQAVFNSVLSGNYLQAFEALSGIFGGGSVDPNAARHQQLMNYLGEEFSEINGKLDELIRGQQRIFEGIVKLSEQIEQLRNEMHRRFDSVDYNLRTIRAATISLLNQPVQNCQLVERTIKENLYNQVNSSGQPIFDTVVTSRDRDLAAVMQTDLSVNEFSDCLTFLRRVFNAATSSSSLQQSSLYARYQLSVQDIGQRVENSSQQDEIQQFEKWYGDSLNRVATLIGDKPPALASTKIPYGHFGYSLAALASPAPNLREFENKQHYLGDFAGLCVQKSILSEPLFNLICSIEENVDLPQRRAPAKPDKNMEAVAESQALKLLNTQLAAEPISELLDYALFFAPISDVSRSDGSIHPSWKSFLESDRLAPKADRIYKPAIKTVTLAIAQLNMLQGDLTAHLVFNELWAHEKNRFLTQAEIDAEGPRIEQRKAAFGLVKNSYYLSRNVLMVALDRSWEFSPHHTDNSMHSSVLYRRAYELAKNSVLTGRTSTISEMFPGIEYASNWLAKDPSAIASTAANESSSSLTSLENLFQAKNESYCSAISTAEEQNDKCYLVAYGKIGDLRIELPTPSEYSQRQLIYPPLMIDLLNKRDEIAKRRASYFAIKEAALQTGKSPESILSDLTLVSRWQPAPSE